MRFGLPHDEEGLDQFDTGAVWPVISDIMAAVSGLFVLLFVWAIVFQVDLAQSLREERKVREAQDQRLAELEHALANPLSTGKITLDAGRIGIQGHVLFPLSSAELSSSGQQLLLELAEPLKVFAEQADTAIMVGGYTDDLPMSVGNGRGQYQDNWQLSTERALTVTRALIQAGFPSERIFAAGFGENKPVVPNDSEANRALNRRVELSPLSEFSKIKQPFNTPSKSTVQPTNL